MKRHKIIIWISTENVYIVEVHRRFNRYPFAYEGSTYKRHYQEDESEQGWERLMASLVQIYQWEQCDFSVVLSGPSLQWKESFFPVYTRAQALELCLCEIEEACGNVEFAYDVTRVGKMKENGMYAWIWSAYPEALVRIVYHMLQRDKNRVRSIEALPMYIARWLPTIRGNAYVGEGKVIHRINVKEGIPYGYDVIDELPVKGKIYLQSQEKSSEEAFLLWQDEKEDVWEMSPFLDVYARGFQWHLSLLTAILTG
ncbi:hypothetical protein C3L56_06475 [Veillonellaceae bacterium M2-4]|nr:hypothetical protein [Veillonellaceae bacterium M2-4]